MYFTKALLLLALSFSLVHAGDGTLPLMSIKTKISMRSTGVQLACIQTTQNEASKIHRIKLPNNQVVKTKVNLKLIEGEIETLIKSSLVPQTEQIFLKIPQNELSIQNLSPDSELIQEVSIGFTSVLNKSDC